MCLSTITSVRSNYVTTSNLLIYSVCHNKQCSFITCVVPSYSMTAPWQGPGINVITSSITCLPYYHGPPDYTSNPLPPVMQKISTICCMKHEYGAVAQVYNLYKLIQPPVYNLQQSAPKPKPIICHQAVSTQIGHLFKTNSILSSCTIILKVCNNV